MHFRSKAFSAYFCKVYFPDSVDDIPGDESIDFMTWIKLGYFLQVKIKHFGDKIFDGIWKL